jgi:MFS family permease
MSPIEVRKEVDVVSIDPLFIERQRNRYAGRVIAYIVWLNGLSAIALLIGLVHANLPAYEVKRFADAMLVFGAGSLAGLASAFFAYISRTFRLERPTLIGWRRPLRWCAILAAIVGALCFIGALNMSRLAVLPKEAPAAPSTGTAQPEPPAPTSPQP